MLVWSIKTFNNSIPRFLVQLSNLKTLNNFQNRWWVKITLLWYYLSFEDVGVLCKMKIYVFYTYLEIDTGMFSKFYIDFLKLDVHEWMNPKTEIRTWAKQTYKALREIWPQVAAATVARTSNHWVHNYARTCCRKISLWTFIEKKG